MRQTPTRTILSWTTTLVLFLSVFVTPARAGTHDEVTALMRAGKFTLALDRANEHLSSHPRDPQMRFLKGVIQRESGQTSQAIATFTQLTRDYPQLPEPYNNLAVLYASQNEYEKARSALEMALRTNPSYATAHENLGDVYAKLASQAYHKALQFDGNNTEAQPKLAMIHEVFNPEAKGQSPILATAREVNRATPASPVAAEPERPSVSNAIADEEVKSSVLAWADAWASKSMKNYLGAYSPGYYPDNKSSRKQWEKERRQRILGKASISLQLENLKVQVQGDKAKATFRQHYKADSFSASGLKLLELEKIGGRWLIAREAIGD